MLGRGREGEPSGGRVSRVKGAADPVQVKGEAGPAECVLQLTEEAGPRFGRGRGAAVEDGLNGGHVVAGNGNGGQSPESSDAGGGDDGKEFGTLLRGNPRGGTVDAGTNAGAPNGDPISRAIECSVGEPEVAWRDRGAAFPRVDGKCDGFRKATEDAARGEVGHPGSLVQPEVGSSQEGVGTLRRASRPV